MCAAHSNSLDLIRVLIYKLMNLCNSDKSLVINRKTIIIKGLLFGKSDLLRGLRPYKLKACTEELPGNITQMSRWETGTINFEGIAGITAVIDYIASLGVRFEGGKENFRVKIKTRDNKYITPLNTLDK